MASGSFGITRTGSTSSYINFTCNWSSYSNGSSANSSTVTVNVIASKSSSSSSRTWGDQSTTATVNGSSQSSSGSFSLYPGGSITLLSKTYTVPHNSDGSKSTTISVSIGGNVMWGSGSATVTLDKIPRYATSNQSLSSKTETSITMNWSSDSNCDYIWYSKNNGSSWTAVGSVNASSGSYIISGLNANTTYNIKTRVRRRDSQLTTDSGTSSIATYDYPKTTSANNFTIGEGASVTLYNPLNRNCTLQLIGNDGSEIGRYTGTYVGVVNNEFKTSDAIDKQYRSIPNSQSGTYTTKVTYGAIVKTGTGVTYSIVANECTPTVTSAAYEDTNTVVTDITEDNQLIVRNQSKVQFSTENLVTLKYATISSCTVTVNGHSYNMTVNGSDAIANNILIDSAYDVTATIKVTDSRGLTATREINVEMIDWVLPTAIINLQRKNNFYSESNINVDASYSYLDGKNTIDIKTRYKKINDEAYSNYISLSDRVTSVLNLDNNYEWNVQVVLTDKFGTTTYNLVLQRGMPIIYFDRIKSSTGFNCFPKNTKSVEINGFDITPVTLYEDDTGSNEEIEIDDSFNNYSYIEIYFRNSRNGEVGYHKLYKPKDKIFTLLLMEMSNNSYFIRSQYSISDNLITPNLSKSGYTVGNISNNNNNYLYIVKIIGYR